MPPRFHISVLGDGDAVSTYDAILILSFGGPEGPDDVIPFLENVLHGRNVPRERMLEVADHYQQFGGVSPINEQNRALIAALSTLLDRDGPKLPIYWGNRNWHPLLVDTLRKMADDGIRRALAFVTSAYSSYSGCRQYLEDIERARVEVGSRAPQVDKLRAFFNHPGFIEPMVESMRAALDQIPDKRRDAAHVIYTAHSVPQAMADTCRYVEQLEEVCRLVSQPLGLAEWRLVYQSRSGPPSQRWLEPDICDYLRSLSTDYVKDVIILPVGFISDHLEVVYDLDTEAKNLCTELGIHMIRAATVGCHPRFIQMVRELALERTSGTPERLVLGELGASHDVCPENCCVYQPRRRAGPK